MANAFRKLETKIMTELEIIKRLMDKNVATSWNPSDYLPSNHISGNKGKMLGNRYLKSIPAGATGKWGRENALQQPVSMTNSYVWKIDKKRVVSKEEFSSFAFDIAGQKYQMKGIPHHLNAAYLYLTLQGLPSHIPGSVPRNKLTFRFVIADQVGVGVVAKDLTSQLLEYGQGFRISTETLNTRSYITEHGLSVKLLVLS